MADALVIVQGTCLQCGALFERTYKTTRHKPFLCSNACKVARFRALKPCNVADQRKREAAKRQPLPCECGGVRADGRRKCSACLMTDRSAHLERERNRYYSSRGIPSCPDCGASIANDGSYQRRCEPCRERRAADSLRAGRRVSRSLRRAKLRCATVERVDPIRVFERDGWRCQCCRKPAPRDKRGTYHPRAPELDHIIPLSKGGEHSYRNTQLLCRACNAEKSDSDEGQQMRLFG